MAHVVKGLAAGLVGGLAGSWIMSQFQALVQRATTDDRQRSEPAPSDRDATVRVATLVSERGFGHSLTREEKKVAGPAVHYAFGAAVGAAYGVATELLPASRAGLGAPFGVAVWAGADEAALPLLGLAKSPTEYPLATHVSALAPHVVYRLTTEVVRGAVRRLLDGRDGSSMP